MHFHTIKTKYFKTILKKSITNMFALSNFFPFSHPLKDIPLDDTAQ